MPQTIRLEFAKSNTKVSKPKQPAAAAATSHPALMHPLTGRKYAPPLVHSLDTFSRLFSPTALQLQPYLPPCCFSVCIYLFSETFFYYPTPHPFTYKPPVYLFGVYPPFVSFFFPYFSFLNFFFFFFFFFLSPPTRVLEVLAQLGNQPITEPSDNVDTVRWFNFQGKCHEDVTRAQSCDSVKSK